LKCLGIKVSFLLFSTNYIHNAHVSVNTHNRYIYVLYTLYIITYVRPIYCSCVYKVWALGRYHYYRLKSCKVIYYYSVLVKHSPAQYNVYLNNIYIYIYLIQNNLFKCLHSLFWKCNFYIIWCHCKIKCKKKCITTYIYNFIIISL